ncbi:MAG: hypothetical protein LBT51_08920 [Fusobacteriaceae bacterium]|jgi:hypothetical protein|nr:hypothetical protein [Fusobacteriaceae bacterium]
MEYLLKISETDVKFINGEEVVDMEEVVENDVSIISENNEINIEIKYDDEDENLMEEERIFNRVNNIFKKIILDKNNDRIKNIDEIFNKFKDTKNKLIYNPSSSLSTLDSMVTMSTFYENKDFLEHTLKKYNIIPYLDIIDLKNPSKNNNIEKKLYLYGILPLGVLEYKIKFISKEIYEDDNKIEIIFNGNGAAPPSEGISLENSIIDMMELAEEIKFFISTSIKGRYVFYKELESMQITINFLIETMKDLKRSKYATKEIKVILTPKKV